MKLLIVVDMQNDFVTGALGTKQAKMIVPDVLHKLDDYDNEDSIRIFTRDTHMTSLYPITLEGKKLPIQHCIQYTKGWRLIPQIDLIDTDIIVDKITFGYHDWVETLSDVITDIDEIEICGLCTDICVVSNALILRMLYPNMPIKVDAKCCAGTTNEKHLAALEVMKSCQIDIINE